MPGKEEEVSTDEEGRKKLVDVHQPKKGFVVPV